MVSYKEIGDEIVATLEKKNQAYGNAIAKVTEIEKIKYPNGVTPEQYLDFVCDIFEGIKQCRIAESNDPYNEDAHLDLLGYAFQHKKLKMEQIEELKKVEAKKQKRNYNDLTVPVDIVIEGRYHNCDCNCNSSVANIDQMRECDKGNFSYTDLNNESDNTTHKPKFPRNSENFKK